MDDIHALGMTTDLETAAEIIGIGRTLAYELAKNDAFPVRLIRLGRRVVVPTADLTRLWVAPIRPGEPTEQVWAESSATRAFR